MKADPLELPPADDRAGPIMPKRRSPLLPTLVVLCIAAIGLFCFIAVIADMRRVNNARRQATEQARHYTERMHGSNTLPLNLEPVIPPAQAAKLIGFEWISTGQAMDLRQSDDAPIVAWTAPVFRLFGANGHAVVVFRDGRFDSEWMSVTALEEAVANQNNRLEQLRSR